MYITKNQQIKTISTNKKTLQKTFFQNKNLSTFGNFFRDNSFQWVLCKKNIMVIDDLLEKVATMFLKFGIKSVTMDDVARELLISKKTLYQYVKDKNDLVEQVTTKILNNDENVFCKVTSLNINAIEQLFELNKHIRSIVSKVSTTAKYDLIKYYPELFAKFHTAKKNLIMNSVSDNLKLGKKENLYRENLPIQNVASFFVAGIQSIIEKELFLGETVKLQEFYSDVFEYHIRGIANQNGIDFLEKNINKLKYQ